MADNWITRDFADYEQAAGGLGVGEENQVLLGKGGIGDVKVFAHPVEVAAGTAGNEAIGKRLLGSRNFGHVGEVDFSVNPGSAAHFVQVTKQTKPGDISCGLVTSGNRSLGRLAVERGHGLNGFKRDFAGGFVLVVKNAHADALGQR